MSPQNIRHAFFPLTDCLLIFFYHLQALSNEWVIQSVLLLFDLSKEFHQTNSISTTSLPPLGAKCSILMLFHVDVLQSSAVFYFGTDEVLAHVNLCVVKEGLPIENRAHKRRQRENTSRATSHCHLLWIKLEWKLLKENIAFYNSTIDEIVLSLRDYIRIDKQWLRLFNSSLFLWK